MHRKTYRFAHKNKLNKFEEINKIEILFTFLGLEKNFESTVANVFFPKTTVYRYLKNCTYNFHQTWHVVSYSYGGFGGTKFMPVALAGG